MKIIATSNYDLESVDDFLIAENVNIYYGTIIVELLQNRTREDDKYWPILVKDNYELHKWEP